MAFEAELVCVGQLALVAQDSGAVGGWDYGGLRLGGGGGGGGWGVVSDRPEGDVENHKPGA